MLCSVRRCLAHVINLAVQAALSVDSIRKLLKILREMASWIGFSPQRSGSFLGLQRTLNSQANPATPKPALKLVQNSPTRWGSTHDMVERAGVLQNPITVFFAQTQHVFTILLVKLVCCRSDAKILLHNHSFPHTSPQTIPSTQQGLWKTDKKKVEGLRLTDADWETLQAVKTFISPFAKVSKAAEGAAYPTVSMVVLYYNGVIDAMESRLAKGPSPTLQPMIVAALSHLKKYAYITSNEPGLQSLPHGRPHLPPLRRRRRETRRRMTMTRSFSLFADDLRRVCRRGRRRGGGGMVQDDEVSRYLSERVRCDVTALEYWRSATNMQTLRRMAWDYLAIRATSASSERVFSLGRNLISWKRHRLTSQKTRAVMILRSWYSSHLGQRIGEGRRPRGVAPPAFAIEGEGAEEDEEEEEGVEADDTAGGEDAVVGSSSGALA
ncbi:unnamed protein product [Closterium sp. NIES-54]